MSFKTTFLAGLTAAAIALPAVAGDMAKIMVDDPYARSSTMMSGSGAAFMQIMNHTDEDDRLIAASSDIAEKVELHTHSEDDAGVMRMIHVEEGFPIAAGETLMLERGGKHVMFLGLTEPMEQGDTLSVTLTFEKAGDVDVEIPVDLERKPAMGAHGQGHNHGHNHSHGNDS